MKARDGTVETLQKYQGTRRKYCISRRDDQLTQKGVNSMTMCIFDTVKVSKAHRLMIKGPVHRTGKRLELRQKKTGLSVAVQAYGDEKDRSKPITKKCLEPV